MRPFRILSLVLVSLATACAAQNATRVEDSGQTEESAKAFDSGTGEPASSQDGSHSEPPSEAGAGDDSEHRDASTESANDGSAASESDGSVASAGAHFDFGEPAPDFKPGVPPALAISTNLPNLTVREFASDAYTQVRVTSVALFADSTGENFQQALIAVRNFGSARACDLRIGVTLEDAAATSIYSHELQSIGAPEYQRPEGWLVTCLEPGAEGVVVVNESIENVSFSAIASAFVYITGMPTGAAPIAGPTFDELEPFHGLTGDPPSDGDSFRGTLRVPVALSRLYVHFFVRDPRGYYRDHARAIAPDPLAANATWTFTASRLRRTRAAEVTSVHVSLDFAY